MDLLLHVLRIKGRATPEVLEDALDVDAATALEHLAAQGLVEPTRAGYRITAAGDERVEELYAAERRQIGPLIEDVYETFLPLNDEVKQIVTDWQCVMVDGQLVLNDHSDRAHDDEVIDRLHRTDAKIVEALDPADHRAPPAGPLRQAAAAGARADHGRRRLHGGRTEQGQLPHRLVRAARGAARAVGPSAHRVRAPRRVIWGVSGWRGR